MPSTSVDTLLGNPKRAVRIMSVPLALSLLVSQINVLADRSWCSGLGMESMAAIAVVLPIYLTLSGIGTGLGVGASAVISRNIGAGNKEKAKQSAIQAILFGLIVGLILTPILYLIQSPLLEIMGASDILQLAESYMAVYAVFTVLLIINGVVMGILNGQGATGLSTVMMIVMAASNIILDPILIYVLDMGIAGASSATVISILISTMVGIYFILSRRTYLNLSSRHIKYEKKCMHDVIIAGVPQMIEYAIMWSMNAVLNWIVLNAAGAEGLTIYSVPDNIVDLIVIPALAIGSASVPVASSALGQKDPERMRTAFRYSLMLALSCVLILTVISAILAGLVLYPFTYSGDMEELRTQIIHALRVMCWYGVFFSFTPICSGYMQAMRHPNRSVICAVWRNIVLITMYSLLTWYMGLEGVFYALIVGHLIGAVSILSVTLYTERRVSSEISVCP